MMDFSAVIKTSFTSFFATCTYVDGNKGNNKITEHRTIFQRERQNSQVNNRKTSISENVLKRQTAILKQNQTEKRKLIPEESDVESDINNDDTDYVPTERDINSSDSEAAASVFSLHIKTIEMSNRKILMR